jgi:catalase
MHLTKAFSFELDHCDDPVVYKRMTERIAVVSLELAQAVAANVGGETPSKQLKTNPGTKAKGLSQLEYMPEEPTIATRRISILIADGFDYASYTAMKEALSALGAFVFTIGTGRAGVTAETGEKVIPDNFYSGMRSTLFDAVFVPGGKHVEALAKNGVAKFWITESFAHLKPIAGVNEAVKFISAQIALDEVQVAAQGTEMTESYGVVTGYGDGKSLTVNNVAPDAKGLAEQFVWHVSRHRNWARELDGLSDQVAA